MKAKMEERNKHAEFVRQNKEKLAKEGDTVPESAWWTSSVHICHCHRNKVFYVYLNTNPGGFYAWYIQPFVCRSFQFISHEAKLVNNLYIDDSILDILY